MRHRERATHARPGADVWLCGLVASGEAPACASDVADRVVSLAREHRLDARAGAVLSAAAPVPDAFGPLVDAWRRTLGEQALWNDLLHRIDGEFSRRGVRGALLKGADLAARVYGPGERPHNDLDLLVEPGAVDGAGEALFAAGLVPDHPDSDFAARHWFASTWRDRARPRLQVDLHWGLGPRGRVAWTARDVLARAQPVPGWKCVERLEPLDLVVHLALHAVAFHGATGRWIWWLDVQRACALVPDGDALFERARSAGGSVALSAALARVQRLFGTTGPRAARRAHGRGALVARLGASLEREGRPARLGGLGRRLVAAASVDRAAGLGLVALDVVRRTFERRDGRASKRQERSGGE